MQRRIIGSGAYRELFDQPVGASPHIQPTGQNAVRAKSAIDATIHHVPQFEDAPVEIVQQRVAEVFHKYFKNR